MLAPAGGHRVAPAAGDGDLRGRAVDGETIRIDTLCGRLALPTTYRLSRFVRDPARESEHEHSVIDLAEIEVSSRVQRGRLNIQDSELYETHALVQGNGQWYTAPGTMRKWSY